MQLGLSAAPVPACCMLARTRSVPRSVALKPLAMASQRSFGSNKPVKGVSVCCPYALTLAQSAHPTAASTSTAAADTPKGVVARSYKPPQTAIDMHTV